MIEIKIDSSQLEQAKKYLANIPGALDKAVKYASARTLSYARTQINKLTREKYHLTAGDINKSMSIKTSPTGGELVSRGRRKLLSDYKISPKAPTKRARKTGLKGAVKKAGGMKSLPRAFFIRGQNSGKPIPFERTGRNRDDVHALISPAVPQALGNEEVIRELEPDIQKKFAERIRHEALRLMGVFAK